MVSETMAPAGEPMSVGRVLSRSFAVIASNPVVILGIAFLFGALPGMVLNYYTQTLRLGLAGQPDGLRDGVFLTIATGILGLVLTMIVQGALVRTTIAYTEGRRATFGESVGAGLRVVLPLIGLALIVGFGVGIGFLLFFVPGIIVYLMWSVASPVLVAERTGVIEALGRSRGLTKGARWKIFGLQLIILVFYWLLVAAVGYLTLAAAGGVQALAQAGQTGAGLPLGWLIGSTLTGTLLNTFWSTAQTALYVELRDWKDGPHANRLEGVFG